MQHKINATFLICGFALLCLCLTPKFALSKNLYVSLSGDDTVSYANNDINSPWASPERAWYTAAAGDSVFFREGTYIIESQIVTKTNGNDGFEGAPIVFTSYVGEQAEFSTATLAGVHEYVFGIQRSYNYVENIDFYGSAAIWFYLGEDNPAHHFQIRDCYADLGTGGDNTGFVKSSPRSDYLVVDNCEVFGPGQNVHLNSACLYLGSIDYGTITNNTLHDSPIGIYFKTDNDEESNNRICSNYIYNCSRNSIQTNSQYSEYCDNIIGANCGSFQVNEGNGFALGDFNTIHHNTVLSGGLFLNSDDGGADNNTIINNILINRNPCCDGNMWDFNLYISGQPIGSNDIGDQTPSFVVLNPIYPADFVLQEGSVGAGGASDGNDLGATDPALVGRLVSPGRAHIPIWRPIGGSD